MANISILEQDLTTAKDTSTTSNVVYVPGYAIMGPANEPTLCKTLTEFKKIFGAVPYTFKHSQSLTNNVTGARFITAGDYEKSYIYAAELLKVGLPVLFERVTTSTERASLEVPLVIKKLVGSTNSVITLSFNHTEDESTSNLDISEPEDSIVTYTCHYNGDLDLNQFNLTVSGVVADSVVYDNNAKTITFSTIVEDGATPVDSITVNVSAEYKVEYSTTGSLLHRVVNGNYSDLSNNQLEINIADRKATFIDDFNGSKLVSLIEEVDTNQLNQYGHIYAKYSGEYGKNIAVTISKHENDNNLYYDISIKQTASFTDLPETKTISLNEALEKYYYENVEFDLVDIELPYYDYNLTKYNLVTIADSPILNNGKYALADGEPHNLVYSNSDDDEFTIPQFYANLVVHGENNEPSILEKLSDRDAYQIKFITTGGYPTFGLNSDNNAIDDISKIMLQVAGSRGDCVALIDHIDPDNGDISKVYDNLTSAIKNKTITTANGEDAKKYGAMFTPWAKYKLNVVSGVSAFPGSFAYLRCLAISSKTNADWFAVAGATRGQVPDLLGLSSRVSGALADIMQPRQGIAVNPITDIKPYGYCIWGNRTLFNNIDDLTASSFLNIRMLTSDVKKVVYKAAKKLTFELNSDVLWLNFKAAIEPTLDQMVSGNGLRGYKIIKVATDKKATIACKIKLFAIEAVEDWDITVELADGYTSVE